MVRWHHRCTKMSRAQQGGTLVGIGGAVRIDIGYARPLLADEG